MRKQLKELSSSDIDRYFRGDPNYYHCTSKDLFRPVQLDGRFAVVNMQDSDAGNGTHWVLVYDCRPNEVIYFDSMGEVPPQSIKKFMDWTGKRQVINKLELQAMGSVTCGYWCELIADLLNKGESMKTITSHFSKSSPEHNDELIQKYFG